MAGMATARRPGRGPPPRDARNRAAGSHTGPVIMGSSPDRQPLRMKTPTGLQELIDDGVVDEVLRPLKSGKEASVYVVRCGDEVRCAKVYKDMAQRRSEERRVGKECRAGG